MFTVKETCERLGISRATLWRMIKKKEIRAAHIGSGKRKLVRFRPEEIERYVKASTK